MVRTIIKPESSSINLSIPQEYIGEEVEILVFTVNTADSSLKYSDENEKINSKRQEGFNNFMKYKGTLPSDFDYKKELKNYRDERYDNFN